MHHLEARQAREDVIGADSEEDFVPSQGADPGWHGGSLDGGRLGLDCLDPASGILRPTGKSQPAHLQHEDERVVEWAKHDGYEKRLRMRCA
ncbi:hypothetical protein SUGI_0322460 [Cryptomeria japonica]|nr:hypothetical protein SUGI_0322460 [Cryptomeria japonica]